MRTLLSRTRHRTTCFHKRHLQRSVCEFTRKRSTIRPHSARKRSCANAIRDFAQTFACIRERELPVERTRRAQFFTLDPGDKTKERVKELVEEKLNESVLQGRLKEQLKEVVRARVDAFLTKGDPIQRIVDHYHEIETIGTPF